MLRSLTVAVLITVCGGLAIAQTDVSGSWTLTIDAGQGGANDTPMMLEQDGDRLTGTYGAADAGIELGNETEDQAFAQRLESAGPLSDRRTGAGTIPGCHTRAKGSQRAWSC